MTSGPASRSKVLIVEDESEFSGMVREILDTCGYEARVAESLEAARRQLADGTSSLVLLDIHLRDGESGLDLLHELAPRTPDVAVVIMTGENTVQVAVDCLREGAFDYIVKPFSIEQLKQVLARAQERQRKLLAERERVEEQLRRMALHDGLTGLPNRILLEDRLEQAIARARRDKTKVAVVFVDLDDFKQVNNAHGHRVGDRVLAAAAQCLQAAVRRVDTVARCGGDEMVLLLPDIREAAHSLTTCERIKHTAQAALAVEAGVPVTFSMGIALYPDNAAQPETLLQMADTALYVAKLRDRNGIVLFSDPKVQPAFQERTRIRSLLARAIASRAIEVHYQPVVDARTGRWSGVEALARWRDEQLGTVDPGTFIPLAEEMGLIGELGSQVMQTAVRDWAGWEPAGLAASLSLNVSLRQLFRQDFAESLVALTTQFKLQPHRLVIEITESQSLLGLVSETKRLDELSAAGFQIAIDDFGWGYSSLSNLHQMPVSELKIDMRFVRNLKSEKGRRIVQAIVEMARALSLRTQAEGIETAGEAALLKRMGVDRLQGYYFAKPMPAKEAEIILRSAPPAIPRTRSGFRSKLPH